MKIQKISDITPTLPFTEFDFLQSYRESFAQSELVRIHSQLPLKELAAEYTNLSHKSKRGNKLLFSGEGEIALIFLKSPELGIIYVICRIKIHQSFFIKQHNVRNLFFVTKKKISNFAQITK